VEGDNVISQSPITVYCHGPRTGYGLPSRSFLGAMRLSRRGGGFLNENIDWENLCSGCGECCGPVPISLGIVESNKDLMQHYDGRMAPLRGGLLVPLSDDMYCVFLDRETKRCLIYDRRPDVCRLQGTIRDLPCPKLNPDLCDMVGEKNMVLMRKARGDRFRRR